MLDRVSESGMLEPHSPYCRWHEQRVSMLIELWTAGVHADKIAARLGATSQSIFAKARQLNLPLRGNPDWPDERVAELTKLWADGLSASQCAGIMGITRNAVIGKVHRLKLPARATRIPSDAERASRRAMFNERRSIKQRISRVRKPPREVAPEPIPHEALMVPLMELKPDQCRFPLGESPFLFCGLPVADGSWCAHCAGIVFRRVTVQPYEGGAG